MGSPPTDTLTPEVWREKMREEHLRAERLRIAMRLERCGCDLCHTLSALTPEEAMADPWVAATLSWVRSNPRQASRATPAAAHRPDTKPGPTNHSGGRPRIGFVSPADLDVVRRLSTRQAAEALGVSRETVRRWRQGLGAP